MVTELDNSNKSLSNTNLFLGKKFRITVLTPRLVRIEYNEKGNFVDDLTELVMNRNFSMPEIYVKQDERYLQISSKYFVLEYDKERPFNKNTLRISLIGTNEAWYYNHPEVRNLYGTNVSIEKFDKKMTLKKGLYSLNGFSSIDDSKSMLYDKTTNTFKQRTSKSIDTYVFLYNKDFGLCLNDYFTLTGFPPLVPRYALGVWWCKDDVYNTDNVLNIADDFIKRNIPLSTIVLDSKWKELYKIDNKIVKSNFTFNSTLFPNPKEMIDKIHNKGIRLGLHISPDDVITSPEKETFFSDINSEIKEYNLEKSFLDDYYNKALSTLEKQGIDFFFLDYLPQENKQEKLFFMNFYQFNHQNSYFNKRPMILSRNATKAGHRYPVLYSGRTKVSFNLLKYIPFYNLSSANIGISWWSHDIGGYFGGVEDNELYVRSVQLGTFSPIFRFHGGPGKYVKREPWRWDIKTYKIVDDYLKLRNKLIPYLYTEGYNYYKKGVPLIQPLYYRYPWTFDDLIYRNQYYFGSQLLISPISDHKEQIMNRTIHKFFIPEGTWYDFRTGKKFPGGEKYVSFYKEEDYPVFAKSGAIIPLSNDDGNDINPPENLEIDIFPGKSNTFNLFEDDGVTNLYKEGYYLTTAIDYNYQENNYTVIIRSLEGKTGIIPKERNYKIKFRNTKQAEEVIVYFNQNKYPSTSYVIENDFVVEVSNVPTVGQLTINCKGQDIEINALRVINDDIDSILMDLPIETEIKNKISLIIFNENLELKKKRVEIRKLKRIGLEKIYIKLFLRLLEYIKKI